jgi:mRNA interferase MazF
MRAPDRGDLIKMDFNPAAGHEQAEYRPALVLSPTAYNNKTGLAIVCAITNQQKGYPFEVELPLGLKITGVILADQIRTIDWQARNVKVIDHAPPWVVAQVQEKLSKLTH